MCYVDIKAERKKERKKDQNLTLKTLKFLHVIMVLPLFAGVFPEKQSYF